MKLRHQIMLLLAVPIICQAATVAILLQVVGHVDSAVREEQNAKDIIAACKELDGLSGRCVLSMAAGTFGVADKSGEVIALIQEKDKRLKKLVAGNKQASKVMEKYDEELLRFLSNFAELTVSLKASPNKAFLAQFYSKDELAESMMYNFEQIEKDGEDLVAIYRPMTLALRPEAVKARADLKKALFAVMLSSILLTAAIAAAVNKQTLKRLQTLMENIRAFARGEKVLQKLEGKDELAELDQVFRDMSHEKFRLDEIQNSLRAMVSHDLRAPLTSIQLSLDFILDTRGDSFDAKTAASLRRIHSEIQRLSRLARTLLDIEKLEGGKVQVAYKDVTWNKLVDTSLAAVTFLAQHKQIEFETSIEPDMNAYCDEDRTIQCIVNLLSNAIKFSPKGSTVKLVVSNEADGMQKLQVIDKGPGVPESQQNNLFNKFVQFDQPEATKKEGSGLGLYICRLLIEAQGGKIAYQKVEPEGSCFYLQLPEKAAVITETS